MQEEHYDGHHFDLNMNTQVLADRPFIFFSPWSFANDEGVIVTIENENEADVVQKSHSRQFN
jgi:hypothetical protein